MVHQWGFFGSISAIRKIWSLTANSRSLQAAALKFLNVPPVRLRITVAMLKHVKAHKLLCHNGNGEINHGLTS